MEVLALDLGGTKLAVGSFSPTGDITNKQTLLLKGCNGADLGALIRTAIAEHIALANSENREITAIGISVPGISNVRNGTVWAPNIRGWDNYPLCNEVKQACGGRPVVIESDRSCYILGEVWKGTAEGCEDAIFLAVGTGIGAGILAGGKILRGANDIAGAIGWMALNPPYHQKYQSCGNFEYFASGEGIVRLAKEKLFERRDYTGELKSKYPETLSASDIFKSYEESDPIAVEVLNVCIQYWGMAIANLVSLFNPKKIILGGGVFGPGQQLIPAIAEEARKWSQPISWPVCSLEKSALGSDAGLYGAAYAALQLTKDLKMKNV